MKRKSRITETVEILRALGMPRAQLNPRTAYCLLALLNLTREKTWVDATAPCVGITPMMEFAKASYGKKYAPNTRETFRRQSMHQLVQAGIALYNPDDPARPTNSPYAVYQIAPTALALLKTYDTPAWDATLARYLAGHKPLAAQYAQARRMAFVPVCLASGQEIQLSPGKHNELIKAIVEEFIPRFVPGGVLLYAGDTGDKEGYFDRDALARLGVCLDRHGKMPDVVVHDPRRNWLVLVESVTSHGPMDGKRHAELSELFVSAMPGRVFVTAFPDRATMKRYLAEIAWETEVWIAKDPTHMIHFNGSRFLGPY
ncbi:MAG: BsuBI/PstI family type II restriction endonuclease [Lentisphaeria bacterium]